MSTARVAVPGGRKPRGPRPGSLGRRVAVSAAIALLAQAVVAGSMPARAAGPPPLRHHPMIQVEPTTPVEGSAATFLTATNWSGYAVAGGTYTSATGCWTVPTVTGGGGNGYSSSWVGIDGFDNQDLIQTGTEQDWWAGVTYYQAWWEILPAEETVITGMTISPGDEMCGSVAQVSGDVWTISLQDVTRSETFSQEESYGGLEASAEWIQERPYVCDPSCGLANLADYGETTFDRLTLNGGNPGLSASEGIEMAAGSTVLSIPSYPDLTRDGFNVAYGSTQPSPPSETTPEGQPIEVSSTQQYTLHGSDGVAWVPIDAGDLGSTFNPSVDSIAVSVGNADLWTAVAVFNQDIGIEVTPLGGSPTVVAWKESGGFAGTFSPNAAAVQGTYSVTAGTTYTVTLVWKTNRPMPWTDQIHVAAGQAGAFSPTTLITTLYPAATSPVTAAGSTQQYDLAASGADNGTAWRAVDAGQLAMTLAPSASSVAIISGNADLWTATAGINQDIGIQVTPDGGSPAVVAWKESGGFAGTFSPNAAFVQARVPMTTGIQYTITLVWRSNVAMATGDAILIGAGMEPAFSPTTLFSVLYPAAAAPAQVASSSQYTLAATGFDSGTAWRNVDATGLSQSVTPSGTCQVLITGNADLWTANAGINQDIGIEVTPSGGSTTLVAWKESGGFAGTFSPNAAFVQGLYTMSAATTYTVTLVWRSNVSMATGDAIWIAAGSTGAFSPTTLFVDDQGC